MYLQPGKAFLVLSLTVLLHLEAWPLTMLRHRCESLGI